MRLALMELDRENGVDVGDGLSSADRLAGTSMPKRRRRDAELMLAPVRAGRGRGRGKGRSKAEAPEVEDTAGGRRRRKRAGFCRCRRGRSRRQERSSRARGSTAPAAKPRRWHEPHAPSSPSSVERGARGRLPRRSCSRGWCRFQGRLASDAPADKGGKSRGEEERAPRSRRRHSSGAQQKPSVPSVADQVSDGEVKVTRRRPGDGGERLPRLRVAPLATSASRARIAVARARPTRVKSAVAVAVPASRARMVARARPRLRLHHNRLPANNARERI